MTPLPLDHLAFPCRDVDATLRFHREVLGATLVWATRTGARLAMALRLDGGPTIGFAAGDGIPPLPSLRPGGDVAHVGLVVADAATRERWKRRLAEHHVAVTVEDAGPEERLYFADPSGVVFEIEAASPAPAQSPSEALEIVRGWISAQPAPPSTTQPAVVETFVSVEVADMARATAFYVAALGATVAFASPGWTSLHVAGVRVGLALVPAHGSGRTGLHFAVPDLAAGRDAIARAGGRVIAPSVEVAPGVILAEAADSEGNLFVLARR